VYLTGHGGHFGNGERNYRAKLTVAISEKTIASYSNLVSGLKM